LLNCCFASALRLTDSTIAQNERVNIFFCRREITQKNFFSSLFLIQLFLSAHDKFIINFFCRIIKTWLLSNHQNFLSKNQKWPIKHGKLRFDKKTNMV